MNCIAHTFLSVCLTSCVLAQALGTNPPQLAELRRGQRVRVAGACQSDGLFVCRSLTLLEGRRPDMVEGVIQSAHILGHYAVLRVLGIKVVISERSSVHTTPAGELALHDLRVGTWVRAHGKHAGKAVLLASEIQHLIGTKHEFQRLEGTIQWLGGTNSPTWGVLDVPVIFDKTLRIEHPRAGAAPGPATGIKRDDDDQRPAPIQIGSFLVIGGKAELEFEPQDNLGRTNNMIDSEVQSRFSLKPEIAVNFTAGLGGYAKLQLKRKPLVRISGQLGRGSTRFRAAEMYLVYRNVLDTPLQLRVGRQRFKDKREWLVDENLDALRLIYDASSVEIQLAVVDGNIVPQTDRDRVLNQVYYYLSARKKVARRTYLRADVLHRNDLNREGQLTWLVFSTRGQLSPHVRFHGMLSPVFGSAAAGAVRGFGLDVGLKLLTQPTRPFSLSLGYAYGSADHDATDKTDTSFRQTGLQDNSARLGGLKRVKYYGLVFKPELSNMQIWTVGMGWQPTHKTSLETVFHLYTQVVPQSFLRDTHLSARPLGRDTALGKEIDFFYTLREIPNVDLTFSLGYFRSGKAFGSTTSQVLAAKIAMQIFY